MSESTLVSFRRAIAAHIAKVTDQSIDTILPLVQQNTSHRKASHSVFSVVIKRLQNLNSTISSSGNGGGVGGGGGGRGGVMKMLLDEGLLERCCTELSTETREWVLQARRTKDMLLFDPQPLQLIRLAVGSIFREYGQSHGVEEGIGGGADAAEDGNVEEILEERAREETSSGGIGNRKMKKKKRRRSTSKKTVVIVDGVKTLQDENAYCCLRRTVLTSFVARCFLLTGMSLSKGDEEEEEVEGNEVPCVKVIADQGEEFLQGLDVELPTNTITEDSDDYYLEIIKQALQIIPELKAQKNSSSNSNNTNTVEDGAWVVDLSAHKLGLVKMFSLSSSKGVGDPTAVVEMMVSMARRFANHDKKGEEEEGGEVARYIWVVPDGRRLFAEQVLHLMRIIFPGPGVKRIQSDSIAEKVGDEEGLDEPERKKRAGARLDPTMEQPSWTDRVEVVYYGPAAGVDLPKDPPSVLTVNGDGISGVVGYTNIKMREVVEENRGSGGVGGYSGAYGDDDGYDDDDEGEGGGDGEGGLNEAELSRMSKILSRSALVVACCGGKRVKKLNISLSRILDGKGNSGVFLQYVLSRLYG
ncbi:hypothetical protein BGZ95_009714 [Linnemannia exigua]|uniref:Uncharacterized protein n=1 Tax=Linnemannia exigua TaxID=604196 RepID=A0AAD4H6F1_9FUNG|nr:hypothetical protein BGZ95_009714 [Linnemannia exigua]